MKQNSENGVGEPGQFKTTPVLGFTPIDHTPTKSPKSKSDTAKRRVANAGPAKKSATGSAEKELKRRVLRHRRKGLQDNN